MALTFSAVLLFIVVCYKFSLLPVAASDVLKENR